MSLIPVLFFKDPKYNEVFIPFRYFNSPSSILKRAKIFYKEQFVNF